MPGSLLCSMENEPKAGGRQGLAIYAKAHTYPELTGRTGSRSMPIALIRQDGAIVGVDDTWRPRSLFVVNLKC